MSFAVAQYRTARVATVRPADLVVQLYDGCIRFLRAAQTHHAAGDIAARGEALGRARAIVTELMATLDATHAPELAGQLMALYDFVLDRITQSVTDADPERLDAAVRVLTPLRDAWAEVARKTP